MPILEFPPVELADEDGLLAVGGDLSVPSLVLAYSSGIFPWPLSRRALTWFAPPRRSILWFKDLHVPRSLNRELRRTSFTFTCDQAFPEVIQHCASAGNRLDQRGRQQRGTWITPAMVRAYNDLHNAGIAHSVETWDGETLVGGLYTVCLNSFVAGESMFYNEPNASKMALVRMLQALQEKGVEWIDCQVSTPLFSSFGAVEIPRAEFQALLREAVTSSRKVFPLWH